MAAFAGLDVRYIALALGLGEGLRPPSDGHTAFERMDGRRVSPRQLVRFPSGGGVARGAIRFG